MKKLYSILIGSFLLLGNIIPNFSYAQNKYLLIEQRYLGNYYQIPTDSRYIRIQTIYGNFDILGTLSKLESELNKHKLICIQFGNNKKLISCTNSIIKNGVKIQNSFKYDEKERAYKSFLKEARSSYRLTLWQEKQGVTVKDLIEQEDDAEVYIIYFEDGEKETDEISFEDLFEKDLKENFKFSIPDIRSRAFYTVYKEMKLKYSK